MCGIVGPFLKNDDLQPRLGAMLTDLLVTMTDRGPDSAGIAIYGAPGTVVKITVQSADPTADFIGLDTALGPALGVPVDVRVVNTHAVATVSPDHAQAAQDWLEARGLRLMGAGTAMEIYKEVGLPRDAADRFGLRAMGGTHGIGHTRMATKSAMTTLGGRIRSRRGPTSVWSITGPYRTTTTCGAGWLGKAW